MTPSVSPSPPRRCQEVRVHDARGLEERLPQLEAYVARSAPLPLSRHPAWPLVLARGLRHVPYVLEAAEDGVPTGLLPLVFVHSWLFGRFLVGLPYLNYGGVLADDDATRTLLLDRAVRLADELRVRFLELRHEQAVEHPALATKAGAKVHMRLTLPGRASTLWDGFDPKVRNQVRKGQKSGLTVAWGGLDRLDDFYAVFSRNMRDLGTPVYPRRLFAHILRQFPDRAELCVVHADTRPAAAALLLHGWGVTEVPSASALREYNSACANMLMYWHLLERTVERGQGVFDFGRSSPESNTFRFKNQWGAAPAPAAWQYYLRTGGVADMRPDNPKYQRFIRVWQRLPVRLTRWLGPLIVRGIP